MDCVVVTTAGPLMLLVSASIDALVTTFRNAGIFIDPSSVVTPEIDKTPTVSDK
jgi:hypothetical protein